MVLKYVENSNPDGAFMSSWKWSLACPVSIPIDLHRIMEADLILMGSIENFETIDTPVPPHYGKARFAFRVSAMLLGESPDLVEFLWYYPNFEEPRNRDRSKLYVVVLRNNDTPGQVRDPGIAFLPDARAQYIKILQDACTTQPFFFESDSAPGKAIQQIFDGIGDPLREVDYFAQILGMNGLKY